MSTQLPTWRFHAVDPSLLVRVDHDDDEASVRPRAKSTRPASSSSNAAGKAAATRKMDQLKEQIAVRRASHDLEQLKMQIAARQAAAMAAPSAANVASVARVKKRAQQPAADGAEAGTSAAGAVSPAKRLRKAAAAKPAPAAAPAPAQPLGKVDNGRSLTTTTAASPVDDDGRPLTDGQLWRVLRALDTAGLLAATGAEARAQAALRPLLAGPSALATLLPLTAPPPPSGDRQPKRAWSHACRRSVGLWRRARQRARRVRGPRPQPPQPPELPPPQSPPQPPQPPRRAAAPRPLRPWRAPLRCWRSTSRGWAAR